MKRHLFHIGLLLGLLAFTGCVTQTHDYTNFRAHMPRSILVLPPLNQSTDIKGTYGYLTTVTRPLAEMGYYVFPIAEVDQLMKENGLPTAGEMHQAPLNKIKEVFGADAVLYITIEQYGQKYEIISSMTIVQARARLVDVETGTVLWEGSTLAEQGSGGSGNAIGDLIAAVVTQVVDSVGDPAHNLCPMANAQLLMPSDRGVLHGPYFPKDREK